MSEGVNTMPNPCVGILVNDKLHSSIPLGKTKYEAVDFYVEAGAKYGFTPCFFRIDDVEPGAIEVNAYVMEKGEFVSKSVPIPQVIHNRAIYRGRKQYRQLASWITEGRQVFNQWNRYGKLYIQKVLLQAPYLRPHLPCTYKASLSHVATMMKLYDTLIIKPNKSSIGRGIMKLERSGQGWKLTYPASLSIHNKKWQTLQFPGKRLPLLLRNRLRRGQYIVQQRLPLATFHERPFDLRVSVQRGAQGQWQITGIVAKVAPKHRFLTNIAQGGLVTRLEHILAEEYPHLQQPNVFASIERFSLQVAEHLGCSLPHMADLGLDIAITVEGFPMLIECNGKDQRYSFREAGMLKQWKATYENPMAYARFLLDHGLPEQRELELQQAAVMGMTKEALEA
ncbi:YheC/YheD family endospore coat-associated protein [Paenibacillus agricola]|uniref:YheC/YheD family protein n=1 Tax=Paenibacillus agricola TaxID=2716264 RepID=A0ABX0J1R3_9BACL|nr:YheC/YheD family protein [Paenibacillus agricola]NHN30215.1 YheC/YheD family protein [Paenibacillus agricola]